ncbi:MAG: helix-turn-helix domain-containing protein [Oscillospiraceae bacterium]|nr:helix-turn-helix domain-containing protein [Oscillospiraceae bacterium]
MVDFGKTLKELRQNAGMTQQQLAERLWLSKATVSYYEQSLRYPSPEILIKLAKVFHVSADYLLGIEEKKQTLDVTDLSEEEIGVLQSTIDIFRKNSQNRN